MGRDDRQSKSAVQLVDSHRSLKRLPGTFLGHVGIRKRHGITRRRTPETGEIFGPGGRFLKAGHFQGLFSEDPDHPAQPQVLQTQLPGNIPAYRAELIPLSQHLLEEKYSFFHVPLSYEFDVRLDSGSMGDPANQCIAQWHGIPNRVLGAPQNRHAPFLLGIVEGRYTCVSAATRKLAPKVDASGDTLTGLDRVQHFDLHDPAEDLDVWVRWRLDVCWSYQGNTGWWNLYRNDILMAEDKGPNCYNELRGAPYFQFGIYRLGRHLVRPENPLPINKRSYRNVRIRLL